MARTVLGKITDASTGKPIRGALVHVWDSDSTSGDDFMGSGYTDNNGQYAIQYASGHWDPAPHSITTWRPDIYIEVYMMTQGGWVKSGKSKVHDNRPHRHNTTINLAVNVPNPHARTVWGKITFKDGTPAKRVLVTAFDNDPANPLTQDPDKLIPANRPKGILPYQYADPEDDFMGSTITDNEGNYVIQYEARHWDPGFHGWTYWRPDIYIIVNGKAANSQWWQTLGISQEYSNVRHRDGVRIDLEVKKPIEVERTVNAITELEQGLREKILKGEISSEEARIERAMKIWDLEEELPTAKRKKGAKLEERLVPSQN